MGPTDDDDDDDACRMSRTLEPIKLIIWPHQRGRALERFAHWRRMLLTRTRTHTERTEEPPKARFRPNEPEDE